jgi:zinc protease
MTTNTNHWKNLPGPETIARKVLPNGITLLSYSNPNVSSVYLVGLLNCGSTQDPQEKLGLANFTASMLSRGTAHRSFRDFHEELENRGASLSYSCGTNNTSFHGKALAEDLEILFDLAADGLRDPSFSAEYLERMRAQLLASLAIRDQDTGEMASLLFDQHLFHGHPYGSPQDGYPATIQAIRREDLLQFHRNHYSPQDMLLVVTGAVTPAQASTLAERYFADWQNPQAKAANRFTLPGTPAELIRKHRFVEEKSQADLLMGTFAPNRNSEDYLPVYLGNNILGQFGLMGRIGESVRSRSGLAYYASSSINAWVDSGTWEFSAGTNPENLEKAVELIRKEIERYVSSPVTAQELADSKSNLIGRLPLSLESNAGLANAILAIERFNLGLDHYQRYADRINAITAEQVLKASQKYLDPDHLVIASAGPGDDIL